MTPFGTGTETPAANSDRHEGAPRHHLVAVQHLIDVEYRGNRHTGALAFAFEVGPRLVGEETPDGRNQIRDCFFE